MGGAPVTLEGWYVLHEMYAVDWPRWNAVGDAERDAIVAEATGVAVPISSFVALELIAKSWFVASDDGLLSVLTIQAGIGISFGGPHSGR